MGAKAERRRTELGLTLREVAYHAGLSLPYVANLEKGRGNPTVETIVRVAVALDVSVAYLLGTSSGDGGHGSSSLVKRAASPSAKRGGLVLLGTERPL
jgi:transcriptional regulator with XRE-family HTH domain